MLYRLGGDEHWSLTRYSPFAVPAELRAKPESTRGAHHLDVIVSAGPHFIASAVRRVELPEPFVWALEAALAEQAMLGWPGATAYEEDKSRLESRKNRPESFLGAASAVCRVSW